MRPRIKLSAVCSSQNYNRSRALHQEYIRNFHSENILEIQRITETTVVRKKCYVSCFGNLIEISEEEALNIEQTVTIIRQ